MDAVKFIKERERMCKNETCASCELGALRTKYNTSCGIAISKHTDEAVEVVEKWSEEHRIMTNADKFKEVFGYRMNLQRASCPPMITNSECTGNCKECVKWWNKEYIEPKKEDE